MAGNIKITHEYSPQESASNIKVFVRGRPPEDKSTKIDFIDLYGEGGEVDAEISKKVVIKDTSIQKGRSDVSFTFDRIFWVKDDNEHVFQNMCKHQIDHVLNGFNSCCFAYGQTGSGKTYTMFGAEGGVSIEGESRGMIPRSVEYLFNQISRKAATAECALVCSFLEIYCDQIRDLGKAYLVNMGSDDGGPASTMRTSDLFDDLASKRGNPFFAPAFNMRRTESQEKMPSIKEVYSEYQTMNYDIREDTEGNVFVKDLSLIPVSTLEEVKSLISQGLSVRATHETKMNATSSRSHTVFTVTCVQRDKASGMTTQGMLNLVDLAGSERLKKSESEGMRLKEALHINSSLTALGKVIVALDPSSDFSHVPYRDSKLTRILQNSLGGNSYTTVVAALHPMGSYYEECLSTLQFANRCRNVVNNPRVNYVTDDDPTAKIRRLEQEVAALRIKLGGGGVVVGPDGHPVATSQLPPGVIASLLQKFGIDASVNADGKLVIDGAVVDPAELDTVGDATSGGVNDELISRLRQAGRSRLAKSGSSASVREVSEELREAKSELKSIKKAKDLLGRDFDLQGARLVRAQTQLKNMEHQLQLSIEDKMVAMEGQEERLRGHYSKMLKQVKLASQELMGEQLAIVNNVPNNLKSFMDEKKKIATLVKNDTIPITEKYTRALEEVKRGNAEVIANIELQYQHYMDMKDDQLRSFVAQFNNYREKKSKQQRKVEEELVYLYKHAERLEATLDDISRGTYPVRMAQGTGGKSTTGLAKLFVTKTMAPAGAAANGKPGAAARVGGRAEVVAGPHVDCADAGAAATGGGVLLPRSLRPPNGAQRANLKTGTSDPKHLRLARRIVKKYSMREAELESQREKLYQDLVLKSELEDMVGESNVVSGGLQLTASIKEFIESTKSAKSKASSISCMRPPVPSRSRHHGPPLRHQKGRTATTTLSQGSSSAPRPPLAKAQTTDEYEEIRQDAYSTELAAAGSIEVEHIEGTMESSKTVKFGTSNTEVGVVVAGPYDEDEAFDDGDTDRPHTANNESEVSNPHRYANANTNIEDSSVVRSLRAAVADLQEARQEEVLTSAKVVESLAADETLQYIVALEEERRQLGERNKELSTLLRSSKVANESLQRKLSRAKAKT